MDEIVWRNNIKELVFPNHSEEEFDLLLSDLIIFYKNSYRERKKSLV